MNAVDYVSICKQGGSDRNSPDIFTIIGFSWTICRSRADDDVSALITTRLDFRQSSLRLLLAVSEIAQVLEISFGNFCDIFTTEDTDFKVLDFACGLSSLHTSSLQSILAIEVLEDDLVSANIVGDLLVCSAVSNKVFGIVSNIAARNGLGKPTNWVRKIDTIL